MRFPNAYKGVKKVFAAEILGIIAAILALVGVIMVNIGNNKPDDNIVASGGLLALVALIVSVVSFIIQIVGLHQGGKDNGYIRMSFILMIGSILLGIVAAVVSGIDSNVQVDLSLVSTILDKVGDIFTLFVTIYLFQGIANLAKQLNDEKMYKTGKTLATIILGLFILSLVLSLLGNVIKSDNNVVVTVFGVLGIVAAVIDLIVNIICFFYLGKAVKMLKK